MEPCRWSRDHVRVARTSATGCRNPGTSGPAATLRETCGFTAFGWATRRAQARPLSTRISTLARPPPYSSSEMGPVASHGGEWTRPAYMERPGQSWRKAVGLGQRVAIPARSFACFFKAACHGACLIRALDDSSAPVDG